MNWDAIGAIAKLLSAVGVILTYTMLGGYLAVAYTDALQSVIMLIGIGWILVAALLEVGGLTAANQSIPSLYCPS